MGQLLVTNVAYIIMCKVFFLFGVLVGIAQAGHPVWENKCWDEPRQQCSTVSVPYTTTEYEQKSIQVPKVESVPEEKCVDVPEEKCSTTTEKKCSTKYEQECSTKQDKVCKTANKEACDLILVPVKKYEDVKELVTSLVQFYKKQRKVCKQVPDQQCSLVDRQECIKVPMRSVRMYRKNSARLSIRKNAPLSTRR